MHIDIKQAKIALPIFGGLQVNHSVVIGWVFLVVISLFCVFVNFRIRRMREIPRGFQNVLEMIVGWIRSSAEKSLGERFAKVVAPFCLVVVFYLTMCSVFELLGLEAPITDLSMTFSMGLFTFFLINYVGLRANGILGRVRQYTQPIFVIAPLKLLTDIAVPVSMGCRLFGNALAGAIIMMLIYSVAKIAVPTPFAAYFNLIHIGIQGYIFITLTLAFVSETLEEGHGH